LFLYCEEVDLQKKHRKKDMMSSTASRNVHNLYLSTLILQSIKVIPLAVSDSFLLAEIKIYDADSF
jgi:hypothetical protein